MTIKLAVTLLAFAAGSAFTYARTQSASQHHQQARPHSDSAAASGHLHAMHGAMHDSVIAHMGQERHDSLMAELGHVPHDSLMRMLDDMHDAHMATAGISQDSMMVLHQSEAHDSIMKQMHGDTQDVLVHLHHMMMMHHGGSHAMHGDTTRR